MERPNPSRVLVVGLASSGLAAARLAAADGASVVVNDRRSSDELADRASQLPGEAVRVFGSHPSSCLDGVDLVVVSPGVPRDLELLQDAAERAIPVLSEVEFAWRHRADATLVAVTGSNGKSTVTTIVADMLRASGVATAAGGNLGPPASELVLDGGWHTWVLEISSFQSETFQLFRPTIGVFLNLSQDHLERHPDLTSYAAAKARLFARQQTPDVAVFNADDPLVLETATSVPRMLFSVNGIADAHLDGEVLRLGDEALLERRELKLAGRHNVANALAAALAARSAGASLDGIRQTLRQFPGLAHRHQVVCEHDGVRWIDDSKATNIGATLAALGGYADGAVHLILGGLGKGQDFQQLANEVSRAAAHVYLIGKDAKEIGRALGAVTREDCETLEVAVAQARANATAGQVVLLAPACASFDQYPNYTERGRHFARLAREVAACH